jgi:hypothetical protein
MIAPPERICHLLPDQARDELTRAARAPNDGLTRIRAIETATTYVKAKWPEFFKPKAKHET